MYFFLSQAAGVTILALVHVNSQVPYAGVGRLGHIKRRFYTAKWKVVWFCFGRLGEGQGVIWGVANSTEGRPRDGG